MAENRLHDAIIKTISFMKETNNLEYAYYVRKYDDPVLFKIILEGPQERKIVLELLENGNISVLQTRDVLYGELEIIMNKLISHLGIDDDDD
jgi:hypothetical protein